MSPEAKEHKKAMRKIRDANNREKRRAYGREYRLKNPEKFRAYDKARRQRPGRAVYMADYLKQYAIENSDRLKTYKVEYGIKNRDRIRADKKQYYRENRDRMLSAMKAKYSTWTPERMELARKRSLAYYYANRERVKKMRAAYRKEYFRKNRDILKWKRDAATPEEKQKRALVHKAWKAKNQHKVSDYGHRRRQKIRAVVHPGTAAFIKAIRDAEFVVCNYCAVSIPGKTAHIDHIVPVSRGGQHAPDNLCASCEPCNLQKADKLISELNEGWNLRK